MVKQNSQRLKLVCFTKQSSCKYTGYMHCMKICRYLLVWEKHTHSWPIFKADLGGKQKLLEGDPTQYKLMVIFYDDSDFK